MHIFLRSMCSFAVNKSLIVLGLSLLPVFVFAQQAGGIRGLVLDADFDAPLPAAKVSIAETGEEVTATDEGNYVFGEVEPGRYTLVFSKQGYTRQVKADVVVSAGQMSDADAELSGEFTEMEEFVVQDIQIGGGSEEGLLSLRMEAPAMMDSVGADMMSRAGAGDAASALKLVAGATVQDGKYAVVRGLPDRYVSSQMNGVRLPTADPDKRAVQLDQFPSSLIESIQVSKTFTPDQQGDASGGAVNVVLKGIPDASVLKLKVGTKYKTNVNGEEFLTYEDAGLGTWGLQSDRHEEQVPGRPWTGARGVKKGEAPEMYDWSLTAGGSKDLFGDIRVGGLANIYYKRDASSYDDGVDDKYRWTSAVGMVPRGIAGYDPATGWYRSSSNPENTSLFDVQKSTEELQWGWLSAIGIENEWHKLKLLHMGTHVAEDKATLAEDTRGHDVYTEDAPYRRAHTLEYIERDTETLQFSGEHTIPFPEVGIPGFLRLLKPKADWTVAKSSSSLDSPDKRTFGSIWNEGSVQTANVYDYANWDGMTWPPPTITVTTTNPPQYNADLPADGVGNLQRIWKKINEDSSQYFLNGKVPFEQWSSEEGYLKFGIFNDSVERSFEQRNYSNIPDGGYTTGPPKWIGGQWSEFWTDNYDPNIYESPYGASYEASQEISAWYWMVDVPLSSFFKIIGGTRYEKTELDIEFKADDETLWYDRAANAATYLALNPPADTGINQKDILPSLGFEFTPIDQLIFRANYSQTVARPTFKEMSPIAQQEYAGGDTFIGNPALKMSALKNYDIRMDWTPYQGGLFSLSWFKKNIEDPIEYTQDFHDSFKTFITSVNYPEGTLSGYELEIRQHLGHFFSSLEGLSVGGNLTIIDSEVIMADEDVGFYYNDREARDSLKFGFLESSREMLNAPEYLYNLYTAYDIEKTGTRLGLFYTVKGDTLVAGPNNRGTSYVPSVYAKEYGTLNFSLSQKIGNHWTLGFKVKNLLDPEIQTVYRSKHISEGDVLKKSYTKGREFSVSLAYEF